MTSTLRDMPVRARPPPPDNTQHYTLDNGCPIKDPQATLRIGSKLEGPLLIQDINLLEIISHLAHERIPERLVHAKGAGAYGVFEVTDDKISDLTEADFLSKVGKKTELFARFSTVIGERGSADSVRDSRGFAFKIYTNAGNLDWLFFSTPTFPIRDGGKFPSFIHCQKREPQTGLRSATTFWDFMSRNPETFNTIMLIFSDCGTPKSYRHSNIYSVNTYKFTKADSFAFVRIHIHSNQLTEKYDGNLTQQEAESLTGKDPDAFTRDLYNNIASGNFPSWDVYAQVIKPNEVAKYSINIFDPTKRWPTPLRKFGKITLNENVKDEFGEIEQASFSPTAIVPGWDVSADPILQTRLFAYGSAARYRLGINFHQIEVNKPPYSYNPTKRDGIGYVNNLNPTVQPDYITADDAPPISPQGTPPDTDIWAGQVQEYLSQVVTSDYDQPRELWEEFKENQPMADHFISNVAMNLSQATKDVRERTYDRFKNIDKDLGEAIKEATEKQVPTGDHLEPGRVPMNRGGVGG